MTEEQQRDRGRVSVLEELHAREMAETESIRKLLVDEIEAVIANRDFGSATAAKRACNPEYPYVPVIKIRSDGSQLGGYGSTRTRQLTGLAYATREEAISRAQAHIDASRRRFAADLCKPNKQALREYYGLPRTPLEALQ